jgi:hypothetical protein
VSWGIRASSEEPGRRTSVGEPEKPNLAQTRDSAVPSNMAEASPEQPRRAGISVFLSYPKPCFKDQRKFIEAVRGFLEQRGFTSRTLGVTDYDTDAPLKAIRRLMLESNGLITVAFRRTYIEKGVARFRDDLGGEQKSVDGKWLTTPWAHIEPAMAYQLGLPILIFRQKDVIDDGILERGVIGLYMPEFDLEKSIDDYFASAEWNGMIGKWEGYVRSVVEKKGSPRKLF